MAEVGFYVEKDKYLCLSYYTDDGRVRVKIGETISKSDFDNGLVSKRVSIKMKRLQLAINDYEQQCALANKKVYKSDIEAILAEAGLDLKKRKSASIVKDAFKLYSEMIVNGDILNKGKPFKESTRKHLVAIQGLLDRTPFGSKQIDSLRPDDFVKLHQYFLEAKHNNNPEHPQGYKQNTFATYNAYILTFLKRTHKSDTGLGWHNNDIFRRSDLRVKPEDIDTHIYLPPNEIELLYNAKKVNPTARQTLDAFVFGCCVGLRKSDLKAGDISIVNHTVHKSTQKGGNAVMIPLNALAREIYDKYKGIPKLSNNAVEVIQNIAANVEGLDYDCLYANTESGVKEGQYYKKYELIGTHTMRRSFATNAFKAGVPAISIMKITGHKTESSFMKYIRISNEENAELMRAHPFFK